MESNEKSITASKEFNVPVETLYSAWTEAEQLKQWWKPMKMNLADVVNDLNEGGEILYKFEGESGTKLTIKGSYEQVQPGEKLVYTWNWELPDDKLNSQYKLEVSFKGTESGSSIHIVQVEEADQEAVKPKEGGWDHELDNLASYLENGDDSDEGNKETTKVDTSSEGLKNTQSTDASSTPEDQEGKPDYGSANSIETL